MGMQKGRELGDKKKPMAQIGVSKTERYQIYK